MILFFSSSFHDNINLTRGQLCIFSRILKKIHNINQGIFLWHFFWSFHDMVCDLFITKDDQSIWQSFDFERTCRMLFLKRVMPISLDIYVFITITGLNDISASLPRTTHVVVGDSVLTLFNIYICICNLLSLNYVIHINKVIGRSRSGICNRLWLSPSGHLMYLSSLRFWNELFGGTKTKVSLQNNQIM